MLEMRIMTVVFAIAGAAPLFYVIAQQTGLSI